MNRSVQQTGRLSGIDGSVATRTPTLVIVGRQDQIVPITDSLAIAEQVADAQLIMIDHCGHFPMYEHPQHYTSVVQNWMLDNRL